MVAEACALGVCTRKVEDLVEAMGAQGMSKSLDAVYVKVREAGRTVSKAVLIAIGVADTGEREVLGVEVASGGMKGRWKRFLEGLLARGLIGTQCVTSDPHSGLRAGLTRVLVGTTWQRCMVHVLRDVLTDAPKSARAMVAAPFRVAFMQPTREYFAKRWS